MADIRIKDLATTATSAASDDYLALDGSANGTRKILATNVAQNVTDVTFGSSGPSAKSSIAARAARQGLVGDGSTSGASVANVPAFGTGAWTVSAWVNIASNKNYNGIFGSATGGLWVFTTSTGALYAGKRGSFYNFGTFVDLGKNVLLTITNDGTTATVYKNGVSFGTSTTADIIGNYTVGISGIGTSAETITSDPINGAIASPLIYNRALSAAEVVALYEAGVPSGADYNNAGTTDIKPSAGTYAYWFGTGSISSATASSFTIAAGASSLAVRNVSGTFSAVSGRRYRATIVASGLNSAADFGSQGFTSSLSAGNVSNGTNVIEFTATSTASGYFAISSISSTAGGSISISSIVALGLLLAPDAGQAGGGLTWYDTSGNAANITLPATGVTWNVPTSSKTATGWTFGGSVGLTGLTQTSGTDTQWSLLNSSLSTQISLAVGKAASSGNAMYFAWAYNGGTPYGYIETYGGGSPIALQKGGGVVTIGKYTNAGNGVLQLADHTTSAGGIGFGTDTSLYRGGAGTGTLELSASSGTVSIFKFSLAGTAKAQVGIAAGATYLDYDGSLVVRNGIGGTTALTLDSSQNATFAGTVKVKNQATVNANGTVSVGTSATTIFSALNTAAGNFCFIFGDNGSHGFADIVVTVGGGNTVAVISSSTVYGSPPARTYTSTGSSIQLALASGTLAVRTTCINTGA